MPIKVDLSELDNISGGMVCTMNNDTVNYANLRESPGLNSKIVGKIYNGSKLKVTGKKCKKDGYLWLEVMLLGGADCVWVAGSLLGF